MNESYQQLVEQLLPVSANTQKEGEFMPVSQDSSHAGCSGICVSGECKAGFYSYI